MKKINVLIMLMFLCLNSFGQRNFVRHGNSFIESKEHVDTGKVEITNYTFTDKEGKTYIIYLDNKGKAFIYKTNKDNYRHRKYLSKIGREINPKAYRKE